MKHFDKAVLIAVLAFGTHSTLVARNGLGGNSLSDKNLIAPAVSAANATLQSQQNKSTKLSGKVVDANGDPIIGASITENGTQNVTVTDIDGNFTLNAKSSNATVTVTYINTLLIIT